METLTFCYSKWCETHSASLNLSHLLSKYALQIFTLCAIPIPIATHAILCVCVSAALFTRLGLTRQIIKETFKRLDNDRQAQLNLTDIITANRFRYAFEGKLLPVMCPRRKMVRDSSNHLLECYPLRRQDSREEAAIEFLVDLAAKTKTSPVGLKKPIFRD